MGLFGVQLTHFVGMREKIISLLLNNTDSFTTHFLYLHRDKYAAPNSTHKTRENPCLIYLSKIHFLFLSPSKSYYHFSLSCHPLSSSLMRRLHTWVAIGKPSSSSLLLLLLLKQLHLLQLPIPQALVFSITITIISSLISSSCLLHLHLLLDLHAQKLHSFHYLFQKKNKN